MKTGAKAVHGCQSMVAEEGIVSELSNRSIALRLCQHVPDREGVLFGQTGHSLRINQTCQLHPSRLASDWSANVHGWLYS